MNLIVCSENCLHEKDGFCTMNNDFLVNVNAQNGCYYFAPKNNISMPNTLNEKTE